MSENWDKAKRVFNDAIKVARAERGLFLDEACSAEPQLREEVESLLAAFVDAGSFMEKPAADEVSGFIKPTGQLEKGATFGHYEIVGPLGAGGMGEVYLAKDLKLGRRVAIKILNEKFARNESNLQRFTQEAIAASALNHPNILVIHEIGGGGETNYIVSEFVEGETLREMIAASSVKLQDALDIAVQVSTALSMAHAAHIVHRDIKPENIMVRTDGYVKILDFGLAKLIEQKTAGSEDETARQNLTEKGLILGTVNYMSPEQARGEPVDARTDIFSLGVLIYEMIAGRTPFAADTTSETLANLIHREPQPLSRYAAHVPDELTRIVSKMLRKNRDERYQTMKGLMTDLKDLREKLTFNERAEKSHGPAAEKKTEQFQTITVETIKATATSGRSVVGRVPQSRYLVVAAFTALLAAIGLGGWYYLADRPGQTSQIQSIAVLPFQNDSGNADVEYLSDGMTESLISSLSQIPRLSVKARSSVFRYKGKGTSSATIGQELGVQALLQGRVVQRGQELTLYVELVEAATENSLWKYTYNKTMTSLVTLQNDIARDVADRLKIKLSGADERRLASNYTDNAEAYKLYLKGRYHVFKLTPPEVNKGITYLQQAIDIDPSYALAYAGISEAYRALALAGEFDPTESFSRAKAAGKRAIEIDDLLAEAHGVQAVTMFWYDWDWAGAEVEFKRALELNPYIPIIHLFYAHLLSNTGRHTEALSVVKRARELDPLSPFVGTLEGQFLLHAGQPDVALSRLGETFELDSNFFFPYIMAANAYTQKRMYAEAIAAARRAKELSPNQTVSVAILGYALAKSERRDEARALIDELRQLSNSRYVPPYHIAIIYNGLGQTDEALAFLEKGYELRDPKMAFLKVEPKWDNLRSEPRFIELMRRMNLE